MDVTQEESDADAFRSVYDGTSVGPSRHRPYPGAKLEQTAR
jgi:hypothetical protein